MAGSLTYREYESDHLTKYSIRVDKSNSKLIGANSGEALCNPRGANWELPPKSLILRRVYCFAQYNPNLKRSFIIGNPKFLRSANVRIGQEYITDIAPTAGAEDVPVWIITGYKGEGFTNPPYYYQLDTGLTDGTAFNY